MNKSKKKNKNSKPNLGLDADQSSSAAYPLADLNADNDRISHNPDGEDDQHDTAETPGYSPLEDK